jgi:predicted dehydrogenase
MGKIRIGVVGAGAIAQVFHLPNIRKNADLELVALCDVHRRKVVAITKRYDVPEVYKDVVEMYKNANLDAVLIATPSHLHMPYTIQAIKRSIHVMVESPVALSSRNVKKISTELAKNPGVVVQAGMNSRFRFDVQLLRESIRCGELGKVFYAKGGWLQKFASQPKAAWRYDANISGGGILMDQGVAIVDLLMYMMEFPEIKSVYGTLFNRILNKDVEDTFSAQISLKNGGMINLDAGWSIMPDKDEAYLTLFGDKGSASINPIKISRKVQKQRKWFSPVNTPKGAELISDSYVSELNCFVDRINKENYSSKSLDQAFQVMKVIEAIYKSAKSGSSVKL